jgi:hypothetical protein
MSNYCPIKNEGNLCLNDIKVNIPEQQGGEIGAIKPYKEMGKTTQARLPPSIIQYTCRHIKARGIRANDK